MLDLRVCPACGERAELPTVADGRLECVVCRHRWPFLRLPLFALTGPSAAGKSTVGPRLAERLADRVVVLDQDVLWVAGLRDDTHEHPAFRSVWLHLAAMIHQSGRPVVLCGTVVPAELESLPERVFFSAVHYLGLVADGDTLAARLRARPAWREWDEPRIAEMLEFNTWLRASAATLTPPVPLLDTTALPVDAVTETACAWVENLLPGTSGSAVLPSFDE